MILGDWNSPHAAQEMQSWHCFYALSGTAKPLDPDPGPRRGFDHPPLYVVSPRNANAMGTFHYKDSGNNATKVIDFIAVDKDSWAPATSDVLTMIVGKPLLDRNTAQPRMKHHLPVEGTIHV